MTNWKRNSISRQTTPETGESLQVGAFLLDYREQPSDLQTGSFSMDYEDARAGDFDFSDRPTFSDGFEREPGAAAGYFGQNGPSAVSGQTSGLAEITISFEGAGSFSGFPELSEPDSVFIEPASGVRNGFAFGPVPGESPEIMGVSVTEHAVSHVAQKYGDQAYLVTAMLESDGFDAVINSMDLRRTDLSPWLERPEKEAAERPDDTYFGKQWYLHNTGQSGGTAGVDLNVIDVWTDYTGKGVKIGIWDDGLDTAHPEFAGNYDASLEMTIPDDAWNPAWGEKPDTLDPDGAYLGIHGTGVAGVIAAERNGEGVVGVAYDATIAGVPHLVYQYAPNIVRLMAEHLSAFDVVNHSYGEPLGFYDNGEIPVDLYGTGISPKEYYEIFRQSAENGRDGLGTVHTVASGNDFMSNTADSTLQAQPWVINVGGVDHNGRNTYASPGASITGITAAFRLAEPSTGRSTGLGASASTQSQRPPSVRSAASAAPILAISVSKAASRSVPCTTDSISARCW